MKKKTTTHTRRGTKGGQQSCRTASKPEVDTALTSTETQLVAAGVRNLKEFGYPDCTAKNILTDMIYSQFFTSMLDGNRGHSATIDHAIATLQARIVSASPLPGETSK